MHGLEVSLRTSFVITLLALSFTATAATTQESKGDEKTTHCDGLTPEQREKDVNCQTVTKIGAAKPTIARDANPVQTIVVTPIEDSEIEPMNPLWFTGNLLRGLPETSEVMGWNGSELAATVEEPTVPESLHLVGEPDERLGASMAAVDATLLIGAPGSGRSYLLEAGATSLEEAIAVLHGPVGSGSAVELGDFDGDGQLDAALSNSDAGLTYLVFGPLDGNLDVESGVMLEGGGDLAVGDWDGDGMQDLATTMAGGVEIYLGGSMTSAHIDTEGTSIAFADTNGDGADDLAVGIPSWDAVDIYFGGELDTYPDQTLMGDPGSGTGTSIHGDSDGGLWISAPNLEEVGGVTHVFAGGMGGALVGVEGTFTLLGDGETAFTDAYAADIDGNGTLDMVTGRGAETTVHYSF